MSAAAFACGPAAPPLARDAGLMLQTYHQDGPAELEPVQKVKGVTWARKLLRPLTANLR
jgi:hypothetical protein